MEPAPPTSVELRDLASRCIDRSYDAVYNLATTLPNTAPEERRDEALKQFQDTHTIFKKLLVLTRWSVQSPVADKCAELLAEAKSFTDQTNETNDRLYFLHADLDRAKERTYDLNTAIDVLFGGSYTRLPRVINYAMHPRELPEVDEEASIAEIDDILRFRLIEERIPDKFTHIDVHEGFVTAAAAGEFEMVFTVDGTKPDSLWLVASVNTVLTDPDAAAAYKHLASTSSLRIIQNNAPTDTHYMQLKILIQKRLNQSTTPLVDASDIMRDFCCSLALRILLAQGQLLTDTRWTQNIVQFVPHADDALDIVYWKHWSKPYEQATDGSFSVEEMRRRFNQTAREFPKAGLCVRLFADNATTAASSSSSSRDLLSVQLFPSPPPELLVLYPTLMDELKVPTNMYGLSAEHFLLGAMHVHAASALFCLERHLVHTTAADRSGHATLAATGDPVILSRTSARSFRLSRLDSTAHAPLEVSFDVRTGHFAVFCLAAASSPRVDYAIKQVEAMLQTQCKVPLPGITTTGVFALVFQDERSLHAAIAFALREIVAHELCSFAASCANMEVQRVHQHHGAAMDALGLSNQHTLYFELLRAKDSSVYMVVELDNVAELKLGARDNDDWVRTPTFSVLQLTKSSSTVKFFERFPAIRRGAISSVDTAGKKRKRDLSFVSALFLHVAGLCHQRTQWHYMDSFARKYSVQATHAPKESFASFPFPERINPAPLAAQAILGTLRKSRGMDLTVQVKQAPFEYVLGPTTEGTKPKHHTALANGNLVYRHPPTLKYQPENPIEPMLAHLIMHVKPMAEFGIKLHKTLSALDRYTDAPDGHFFAERADPFGFTLSCRDENAVTRRIMIEHKIIHQHPRGAFVLSSQPNDHVLLPFIQDAFNSHKKSSLLVEVLERTTIPLAILSTAVTTELAGHKAMNDQLADSNATNDDAFDVEQPYADKAFVPSNLVLLPRSQTHVRLTYADRCGVDIFFLANETVNIQSAPCLVRVPSCAMPGGVNVAHETFGETLRHVLFPEMASL
ncbi:Aste57867_22966 [Aphanomyces stellatus]|uniref:Mediator of RNA polymerase II transcription subunit 14 n=1 Tax=Aphanomyces stellatus TaxID=120398 RepID=A0A485LLL6_9STRA|nr:hypothetical protein As57867_022895 [Aphanomyces stellatus]VFT99616.1 Aste57867_22966 [Aphanomyces stellatus]